MTGKGEAAAAKVAERRDRSLKQCPWFFWKAHQAWIFDNSGAEPRLVAWKEAEDTARFSGMAPELSAIFRAPTLWEG